jgi:hypothetical protein
VPCKATASLKILGVSRVKRVGLSSDLCVVFDVRLGYAVQHQNLTQTIKCGFRDWRIQDWIDAKTHSDVRAA